MPTSRRRTLWTATGLALALTVVAPGPAAADGDDPVVLTVGKSTLKLSEVERRLRDVPAYQLAALGRSPDEIRKQFVDQVLVPELLYSEEAAARGFEQEPLVRDRLRDALRASLEGDLRAEVAKAGISEADARAFYEQNKDKFSAPRRLKLARILLATEAEAKALIAELASVTPEKWIAAARDKSLDTTTKLREGSLGFVRPDGQTDTPQLRADPALYAAAGEVKDGELVKTPVKEGERWAVIWRRGSLEGVERSFVQEEYQIRQVLLRKRLQESVDRIVQRLTGERVKDVDDALTELVTVDPHGEVIERQRPGVVPRRRAGDPTPQPGERGLR